jgi:hypothetical protein
MINVQIWGLCCVIRIGKLFFSAAELNKALDVLGIDEVFDYLSRLTGKERTWSTNCTLSVKATDSTCP